MNCIIESLVNYGFLFFLFCLFEIGVLQYYKRKQIEVGLGFIVGYQIFICLLVTVFNITGIPNINNLIVQVNKHMNFVFYLENILSYQMIMNMLMFIPFGIVLPLLWVNTRKLYLIIISGTGLSLFIEISQLFNHRTSDINDVLTNTIGIMLGYFIYKLFLKKIYFFELDNRGKLTQFHAFIHIIMICVVYFFIGSPILSYIHGF